MYWLVNRWVLVLMCWLMMRKFVCSGWIVCIVSNMVFCLLFVCVIIWRLVFFLNWKVGWCVILFLNLIMCWIRLRWLCVVGLISVLCDVCCVWLWKWGLKWYVCWFLGYLILVWSVFGWVSGVLVVICIILLVWLN